MRGLAKIRLIFAGALALLLSALPASPQDKAPKKKGDVPQAQVDGAIQRGIQYLEKNIEQLQPRTIHGTPPETGDELLLLAMLRGGVHEQDPIFQKLLSGMLERKLVKTYSVALQAIVLEELDRVKYQFRILQCAQFLVDNQCVYGEWKYGEPSPFVDSMVPTESKAVPTPKKEAKSAPGEKKKPVVLRRIPVEQKRIIQNTGDFSCTQYAVLGLRACHEAGIVIPEKVLTLALSRIRRGKIVDPKNSQMAGFCYFLCQAPHVPYGSMTAGTVGSLAILDHIKDGPQSWERDEDVQQGLRWLGANFTVKQVAGGPHHFSYDAKPGTDPDPPQWFYYYYLYAIERLGMLCGLETFGGHDWYREGARVLVDTQAPDGSWGGSVAARGERGGDPLFNTSWAILFLRRATRPLNDVASIDRVLPRK